MVRGMETGFHELFGTAATALPRATLRPKSALDRLGFTSPLYRVFNVTHNQFRVASVLGNDLEPYDLEFRFKDSPNLRVIKREISATDAAIFTFADNTLVVVRKLEHGLFSYSYIINAHKKLVWPSNISIRINGVSVNIPKLRRFDLHQALAHPTIQPFVDAVDLNGLQRGFVLKFKQDTPEYGPGFTAASADAESMQFFTTYFSRAAPQTPRNIAVPSWNVAAKIFKKISQNPYMLQQYSLGTPGVALKISNRTYTISENPQPGLDPGGVLWRSDIMEEHRPAGPLNIEQQEALLFTLARLLSEHGEVAIVLIVKVMFFYRSDSVKKGSEDVAWSAETSPALYFLQSVLEYDLPPGRVYV